MLPYADTMEYTTLTVATLTMEGIGTSNHLGFGAFVMNDKPMSVMFSSIHYTTRKTNIYSI